MKTIYLLEKLSYNDSSNDTDTEVIGAFSLETDAVSEASRLDAESMAAWVKLTGGEADPDNIRTTYNVQPIALK